MAISSDVVSWYDLNAQGVRCEARIQDTAPDRVGGPARLFRLIDSRWIPFGIGIGSFDEPSVEVAMSDDGNTVVIGDRDERDIGHVRIFSVADGD